MGCLNFEPTPDQKETKILQCYTGGCEIHTIACLLWQQDRNMSLITCLEKVKA